ncbi:dUTP diphosphatase [Patescibacteria group bacterium]|nr:dUTP diphosphatase [Patescibacteria group bacterium]
MKLLIKKIDPAAKVPSFAHSTDAGLDVCSLEEVVILPGERKSLRTGIAMAIPEGHVGLVWDKSGIAHKGGLKTLGGVIDAGYRGEIFVGLLNAGDSAYTFAVGDKVAQILIQTIVQPELVVADELPEADRGEGAFGSTGK